MERLKNRNIITAEKAEVVYRERKMQSWLRMHTIVDFGAIRIALVFLKA